jgi:hypothetical protein
MCSFCNHCVKHIERSLILYRYTYNTREEIKMCCACLKFMNAINWDLECSNIKQLLSNMLCDPSKIVLEYWNNDYQKEEQSFIRNYKSLLRDISCTNCKKKITKLNVCDKNGNCKCDNCA